MLVLFFEMFLEVSRYVKLIQMNKVVISRDKRRIKRVPMMQSIRSLRLWPPLGFEFRSASYMFDLVSTVMNVSRR